MVASVRRRSFKKAILVGHVLLAISNCFCLGSFIRTFDAPAYRYVLSMEITDHTDSIYISVFNEDAEKMLGISAEELNNLNMTNQDEYEKVFKRALFREYIFTLRVKV